MSLKHNEGASLQSGLAGKPMDAAKAPELPVGEAMERLQSIYGSEGSDDANGKSRRKGLGKTAAGNLIAYAGVKVKGKIGSCDTLTVEGDVDGTVRARQIIVADGGFVVGRAEVNDAEIAGRFEGTLRVTGKLVIRRTGRLEGAITYGQIEIESGGELRGRVEVISRAKKSGWSWAS